MGQVGNGRGSRTSAGRALLPMLSVLAWFVVSLGAPVLAQTSEPAPEAPSVEEEAPLPPEAETPTPDEVKAQEAQAAAIAASLEAINSVLDAQAEKRRERDALREVLANAENPVDEEEAKKELEAINAELARLGSQIEGLATGVSAQELTNGTQEFNLNTELENLIRPFLLVLKNSTENARAIAQLDQTLRDAERQKLVAEKALETLEPVIAAAGEEGAAAERLRTIQEKWERRREAAEDDAATATRQLEVRRAARVAPGESAGEAFFSFLQERGRNLALGIGAFAGVLLGFRLLRGAVMTAAGTNRARSFPFRLGGLIFDCLSVLVAFGAVLTIFNYFNDWLLTGFTILLLLALGWLLLRSLPTIIEQVTLLLNLGAVQEGERLMLNGVPWRVKRLDLYTDLENPSLRGGTFTVPARELTGIHSRPLAKDEVWFPTQEGDWILIGEDELFGEVVFQSPELVQVREEGGAIINYPVEEFLAEKPKNLSKGFRATISFGIDYQHQAISVTTVPATLRSFMAEKLRAVIDPNTIRMVDAVFVNAGESALEYDLEADLTGAAAPYYEDIKEALARFAVECCEAEGWSIPFPQLTIHRA